MAWEGRLAVAPRGWASAVAPNLETAPGEERVKAARVSIHDQCQQRLLRQSSVWVGPVPLPHSSALALCTCYSPPSVAACRDARRSWQTDFAAESCADPQKPMDAAPEVWLVQSRGRDVMC